MSTPPPPPDLPPADAPAATLPPASVPGDLAALAQYQIVREIGRGGMGVVYLARNTPLDRLEVLKVMNTAGFDRPGAVERFQREMRTAARLSHPNVVTAYAAHQVGHYLVFAMEYVDGEDLAKVVKATKNKGLPVDAACYYAYQAARGLRHAHEKGMVHRDIKPSNLMRQKLGKKHVIKVLDFGLAKASIEGEAGSDLTGLGKMLGTPDFVAPEQTRDATNADIRADLYSLGCTLYYLLAGRPPFIGRGMYEVLEAHQFHTPQPLTLVRPEVTPELAAVVARMMAKRPDDRYPTPGDVMTALAPFLRPGGAVSVSPTPSDPNTDLRPPSDPGAGPKGVAETVPPQTTNPVPAVVRTGPAAALPVAAIVPRPPAPPPDLAKPAVTPSPAPAPPADRPAHPPRPLGFYVPWALWGYAQVTAFLLAATVFAFLVRGTTAAGPDGEPPAAPGELLRFVWVTAFVFGLYAVFLSLSRDPDPGPGFRLRWADRRVWAGPLLLAATYGVAAADYLAFQQYLTVWLWAVSVLLAVGLGLALPLVPRLIPARPADPPADEA